MSQDKDQFADPENPSHIRLSGTSMFLESVGGRFVARNVPPTPPPPQPQATTIAPQPKPQEAGGHS